MGISANMTTVIVSTIVIGAMASSAAAQPRWELVQTYTPTGLIANDARVGNDIAVNDDLLITGSRNFNSGRGGVFVFDRRTGTQRQLLTASDGSAGDAFGTSVAISGSWIAVGSPGHDLPGAGAGAVYVFDAASLAQVRKLSPVVSLAQVGGAIAFADENELIAGAENDRSSGDPRGAAYILDVATDELRGVLIGDAGVRQFGLAVAVSPKGFIVGAPDTNGPSGGRVFVFDRVTLDRTLTLAPPKPGGEERFGSSVATGDNLIAVGGDGGGLTFGDIYIFEADSGLLLTTIEGSTTADFTQMDLTFNGDTLYVGAPFDRVSGILTGSLLAFDPLSGDQVGRILVPTLLENDEFGAGVTARDGRLYVSGTGIDGTFDQEGRIFRFDRFSGLEVDPLPLVGLFDGAFTLTNARPNERTWMLYTLNGLSSSGVYLERLNVVIDLELPQVAWGPLTTDDEGDLAVTGEMPAVSRPFDIWFQIVQDRFVSNVVATQIVPD